MNFSATGKEIEFKNKYNFNIDRILHTAREKRSNEKDRVDYIFIKQEQYEEDVTKVRKIFSFSKEK